jgi:hypothetical protein
MFCGVESLGNVALNQDVRNQRQALEGKRPYKKLKTCSGREEARAPKEDPQPAFISA